jgi:metal-sulfur cluster biosynthetic enzyme
VSGSGSGRGAGVPAHDAQRETTPAGEGAARDAVTEPGTERLWAALRDVRDPEFPVSVVDLGLIYAIRREQRRVFVDLTFTATACPCMDFIQDDIRTRLLREPDVAAVEIRVVWDPPWTADRMSDEARAVLRRHGVAA